jgi:hypothetical protein
MPAGAPILAALVLLVALVLLATAGCGAATTQSQLPVEQPTAPGSMPVAASPSGSGGLPSAGASSAGVPSAALTSGAVPPTVIDAGLLAVLPETVDGARVVHTPEAAKGGLGDPSIERVASRLATGYVVSEAGADWAVVSIVALRSGAWNDAFYRDWRDSYASAVCRQEGGVAGRAVAPIGGRDVDIATCGGLRTYNVHLADGDLVISITSAGEGRFGEKVMAGLRP